MATLDKFIDIKLWKQIQDKFAKSIELPVSTIDEKGNEIITSGCHSYFCQLVRSKRNAAYIKERQKFFDKLRTKEDKILVYNSHDGLLSIMVPICVNNEQIAAVICGDILKGPENISKCMWLSKETGIPTLELLDALRRKKIYGLKEVQNIASLLYVLSQTVPEVVHEKFQSDKKVNELTVLNTISNIINSTLELDEILTSMIIFMKQTLEAKECSIIILENNKRFSDTEENKELIEIEEKIKNQILTTKNQEIIEFKKHQQYSEHEMPYNSLISLPMTLKDSIIGIINLYFDSTKELNQDNISFMNIVASQAAMAIINAKQYEQIRQMAITDKLTGLYNRRHFMQILEKEIERAKRTEKSFSVVLIDIDDFSHYNNTNGHVAGDKILERIAQIFKSNVRSMDTVGRYGGEEFIIILPDAEFQPSAEICERIRKAVEEEKFESEEKQPTGKVTISLGFVNCKDSTLPVERVIEYADNALYEAKDAGKNSVRHKIVLSDKLIG